jgi:nitrogenase subunit NifH
MEAFNNITNGLKNIKDIKDIPLLGVILNIIIQLSEQKIRDDICSKLNRNKDKIIESAIRVFVKQITDDDYINNIETKEIYDSINKKIKSMESEKIDKKIDKKVGGKKFTHKKKSKQSKKSKKTNRKSRTNKL